MTNYTYIQYIDDVINDKVPTSRLVKLAVQRHLSDFEIGHERGLHFDEKAANHVIDYISNLNHYAGQLYGSKIKLEPWQQFVLAVIFGWKRSDGLRRFRTAHLSLPLKNGKTTLSLAIALYLMLVDQEAKAEIYFIASTKQWASLLLDKLVSMRNRPKFLKRIGNNITDTWTSGKLIPLGPKVRPASLDGVNPHGVIVDVPYGYDLNRLLDQLKSGMCARKQPLLFTSNTCQENDGYTEKVLDGTVKDDSYFGIIYNLDDEDDYLAESNWVKANPNLGVSVQKPHLRDMIKDKDLSQANHLRKLFKAKHLNIRN